MKKGSIVKVPRVLQKTFVPPSCGQRPNSALALVVKWTGHELGYEYGMPGASIWRVSQEVLLLFAIVSKWY